MNENLGETSCTSSTNFTPDTFTKVDDARPDNESPTEVTKAMFGGIEWEGRDQVWLDRVSNETAGGMGEKTEHEEECQMVGVPEGLKAFLSNLCMSSGVHDHHD